MGVKLTIRTTGHLGFAAFCVPAGQEGTMCWGTTGLGFYNFRISGPEALGTTRFVSITSGKTQGACPLLTTEESQFVFPGQRLDNLLFFGIV